MTTLQSNGYQIRLVEEIWKDVPDFEGLYQVSDQGRVKSCRNNLILKATLSRYLRVSLSKPGSHLSQNVHRMVAKAFLPAPISGQEVNHINGIKTDNRAVNLEWVTRSENLRHAHKLGLLKAPCTGRGRVGSLHPYSKPVIQKTIAGKFVKRFESMVDAAKEIGVSSWAIRNNCVGITRVTKGHTFEFEETASSAPTL